MEAGPITDFCPNQFSIKKNTPTNCLFQRNTDQIFQSITDRTCFTAGSICPGWFLRANYQYQKIIFMYISDHLKWRILVARALKKFYYEREHARRNRKRIFEFYGRYLLGTTYDTFLSYLKPDKYVITDRQLPSHIEASLALLDAVRIACERLRNRKPGTSWSLITIVEEVLTVLRDEEKKRSSQKIHID